MGLRLALALVAVVGFMAAARAQAFRVDDVASARDSGVAQLKPGTVAFSDQTGPDATSGLGLIRFEDWAEKHPIEKKYLSLFPSYVEPTVSKADDPAGKPLLQKLYVYVAQARFLLDQAPDALNLPRYVTVDFLRQVDPAITHKLITPDQVEPFTGEAGTGNANPDRKWCTGRQTSICIASSYKLEGKIPLGIMLVNKLRDSAKKVSDHIDFQSEFSALAPADVDQTGLQQLTTLNTPVAGLLEQNIFYVNQIMKFGKFFAVFQNDPADPGKTVVTAFMVLGIKASVLDEKRDYEKMPVLRNLVPADVLMGKSSFNSGNSISAGLPEYARNEIKTIAGILERGGAAK